MLTRSYAGWWLGLGLLAWTPALRAQTLDEARVIELARRHDPEALLAERTLGVAEAEGVQAGLYPNPALGWLREELPGDGPQAGVQDTFSLTLPIELSGRRGAARGLARAELEAGRADAARARGAAVQRALHAFYAALYAERAAELAQRALDRLEEATRVLSKRLEAGTAAGYERDRLALELELSRSAGREAAARAARMREGLALRLGLNAEGVVLRGELMGAPQAQTPVDDPWESAATLVALRRAEAASKDARSSAGHAWLPALSLTGGLRVGTWEATYLGYVAGLEFDVPVFARGQELRAQTEAQREVLRARLQGERLSRRVEATRAAAELTLLSDEQARFDAATREGAERLVRAAESGYREGQRTVAELLDAHRARALVEARQLELAYAARRAQVDLRAAQGAFE